MHRREVGFMKLLPAIDEHVSCLRSGLAIGYVDG